LAEDAALKAFRRGNSEIYEPMNCTGQPVLTLNRPAGTVSHASPLGDRTFFSGAETMLKLFRQVLVGGMTVVAAASAAQAQTSATLPTSDAYAIKNAIDVWLTSCSVRQLDQCMSMYADDVVGVFQGAAADYDFESLKAGYALSYKKDDREDAWSNDLEEIAGSGDMAFVRSNRTLTQTPKGGGMAATVKLRTTEVLRRGEDGTWKIARFVMYPN